MCCYAMKMKISFNVNEKIKYKSSLYFPSFTSSTRANRFDWHVSFNHHVTQGCETEPRGLRCWSEERGSHISGVLIY